MPDTKTVDGVEVPLSPAEQAEHDQRAVDHAATLAAEDLVKYQMMRKQEYPDVGDQLDAIFKQFDADKRGGKTLEPDADALLTEINAVKVRHPKP